MRNGHTEILKLFLKDGRVDPSINNNQILSQFRNTETLPTIELLKQDERVKAIEFLNNPNPNPSESNKLTSTSFLNLFNSQLKWSTSSYIESVFSERSNNLVATFIHDLLGISVRQAKAIHNLDDFDKYMFEIHEKMASAQKSNLKSEQVEFLWRYYGATMGYKDHTRRFQETTLYMSAEIMSKKRKRA